MGKWVVFGRTKLGVGWKDALKRKKQVEEPAVGI